MSLPEILLYSVSNALAIVKTTGGSYGTLSKDKTGKSIIYLNGRWYYATPVQQQTAVNTPANILIPDNIDYNNFLQNIPSLNIDIPINLGKIEIPKIDIELPKLDFSFLSNIDLSPLKSIVSAVSTAVTSVIGEITSKIPAIGGVISLVSSILGSSPKRYHPAATDTGAYSAGLKLFFDGIEDWMKECVSHGYMRRKLQLLRGLDASQN